MQISAPIHGIARLIHGYALGKPLVISREGKHVVTAVSRRLAVHREREAAGNALFKVIDMPVLGPEVRQYHRCRPHGAGERQASLAHMTAGTVHIIEDVLAPQLLGMGEKIVPAPDGFLQLGVKRRILEVFHGGRDVHELPGFGQRCARRHALQALNCLGRQASVLRGRCRDRRLEAQSCCKHRAHQGFQTRFKPRHIHGILDIHVQFLPASGLDCVPSQADTASMS